MSKRRRVALFLLGGVAAAVVALFAPWIHDRIRGELLLRRLERGDESAAAELAQPLFARRLLDRHAATRSPLLARPLIELVTRGELDAEPRREVFDRAFPSSFSEPSGPRDFTMLVTDPSRSLGHRFVARTNGPVWEVVGAGRWEQGDHVLTVPDGGDVQAYMEWFVRGDGAEARCLFQRCTWVIYPPDAQTLADRFRIETEDLTDIPDPLNLYLSQARATTTADGESAVELRWGAMGTWRAFISRRPMFERSVAYGLFLDRGRESPPREPLHLADVAVSAETSTGKWFARDALRDAPIPNMQSGAHYTTVTVPRSAARLEPYAKLRLRFEPAPQFARSQGFEAPAADCAPFVREYYLPPLTAAK